MTGTTGTTTRTSSPVVGRTGSGTGDRVLGGMLLAAVLCVGLAVASALGLVWAPSAAPTVAPPAARAVPVTSVPLPVSLSVPAIDVDVPLGRLGLDAAGAVLPPQGADEAGWVEVSARPGRPGPAVVAGHVDTRSGPAVFARLGELRPGDRVEVGLDDGSQVAYVVRASEQHPKDAFPTEAVYGAGPVPTLALVTCGGSLDPATGRYRDNVVVFADLET